MLDQQQIAQAQSEGWQLVTTFNNGDNHPFWDVARYGAKFPSDQAAGAAVVAAARSGRTLHQTALSLVYASRQRPTTAKAKAKK